jgi:hypothetical protein
MPFEMIVPCLHLFLEILLQQFTLDETINGNIENQNMCEKY